MAQLLALIEPRVGKGTDWLARGHGKAIKGRNFGPWTTLKTTIRSKE